MDVRVGVKYRLDPEVDEGSGGCKSVSKILTRPRCKLLWDWMGLDQDRDRWRALLSTAMNLRVPRKREIP